MQTKIETANTVEVDREDLEKIAEALFLTLRDDRFSAFLTQETFEAVGEAATIVCGLMDRMVQKRLGYCLDQVDVGFLDI